MTTPTPTPTAECGCCINQNYTHFFHIDKYAKYTILSQLEDNFKSFLDTAFLNIGAFTNIDRPTGTLYGGNMAKLNSVSDPALPSGSAWETSKKDWIWEDCCTYSGATPIDISGVYVNNIFYPEPTGASPYTYNLNYPLGRVTFASGIPLNSNVEMSYSYRNVQVYKSNESAWFKELQYASYDPTKFNNIKQITSNHRVQMPSIVLEFLPGMDMKPYEIGSTSNIIYQDLMLNILTESYSDRAIILDILVQQKDRPIYLYDINKVVNDGVYPLNYDGSINPSGLSYTDLVENTDYKLTIVYIKKADVIDLNNYGQNLYIGNLRYRLEIFPWY
jgi:hypothetical protein